MTISERTDGRWARALGTTSVVLSLIFVGYEIRQNTSVARAAAAQAVAQQYVDFTSVLSSNGFPDLDARLRKGGTRDDFSAAEQFQIDVTVLAQVRIWESVFRSVDSGLIDDSMLNVADTPGPFSYPYVRESWAGYKAGFSADFVQYFEAALGL